MFDFRRITLFCFGCRLSKNKMTIFSKNLGGHVPYTPLATPMARGYIFLCGINLRPFYQTWEES